MNKPRIATLGFSLIALALLNGCQTGAGTRKEAGSATSTTDAGSIEVRAKQRWTYLIEGKAEKAYDYLSPGYRKTMSREQYASERNGRAVKYRTAQVTKKECEEELCEVYLSLDYQVTLPGGGPAPIDAFAPIREKWIKVGGKWYLLPPK